MSVLLWCHPKMNVIQFNNFVKSSICMHLRTNCWENSKDAFITSLWTKILIEFVSYFFVFEWISSHNKVSGDFLNFNVSAIYKITRKFIWYIHLVNVRAYEMCSNSNQSIWYLARRSKDVSYEWRVNHIMNCYVQIHNGNLCTL